MKALTQFACAALFTGVLAVPAIAANADMNQSMTGATSNGGAASNPLATGDAATGAGRNSMSGQNAGANLHIAQKMREDLSRAGFTDIQIMPSSFLVRAKDSAGNPVMMVVNPDSVTAITDETHAANTAGNSNRNTSGATSGRNSAGGSQPGTPAPAPAKP